MTKENINFLEVQKQTGGILLQFSADSTLIILSFLRLHFA
jgi:hypothetical protein